MDQGNGLDERAQLAELHAEARVAAVQRMSRALASAARHASQKLHRPSRIKPPPQSQQASLAASAKSQALAAIKVAPKHKPRVIKFTGAVTVPMEAERLPPPVDAPRLATGWSPVLYRDGPPPVGKPMYQLKTYRSSARRQRQAAGLSSAYKRSVQADLVSCVAEVEEGEAVSQQDAQRMEAWLAHARERMEVRAAQQQQQQQQGASGQGGIRDAGSLPKPAGAGNKGWPGLVLPQPNIDELLAARARAFTAAPALPKAPHLRFQGDLHSPAAAPSTSNSVSATAAVPSAWREVPAGDAPAPEASTKLGSLVSLPPESLRQGVPRSRLAAMYQAKPDAKRGLVGHGGDEEEAAGGEEDVDMDG